MSSNLFFFSLLSFTHNYIKIRYFFVFFLHYIYYFILFLNNHQWNCIRYFCWLYDKLPEGNTDRMKWIIFLRAFPVSKSISNNIFLLPTDS
jgi:hypothetical protein